MITCRLHDNSVGQTLTWGRGLRCDCLCIALAGTVSYVAVSTTLRDLAGTAGLTDVIFLSDIEPHQPATGEMEIEVTTPRPLDPRERARLVQRAEEALRRDGAD